MHVHTLFTGAWQEIRCSPPASHHDLGLILHEINTTKWKCKPGRPSPKEIARHPRLSTTSVMAALLRWTPTILNDAHINGPTVSMRRRNLLQTLELHNSSSRASQLKAFSRFNGKRAAPSSSASSSVILAASNIHAHGLQVQYSIPLIVDTHK
jgi:endo-beta-N-acetylglucosaminidase D